MYASKRNVGYNSVKVSEACILLVDGHPCILMVNLLFKLSDHITCQCLIHLLDTLHGETKVQAYADFFPTEQAARNALQTAAHQAGMWSQLVGACVEYWR